MLRCSLNPNRTAAFTLMFGVAVLIVSAAGPVEAQGPRKPDWRIPEPELTPDGEAERAPPVGLPPVAPPSRDAPLAAGPSFTLRGVEFAGNTVFSTEVLREVWVKYVGKRVSTTQLQQLRRELTLYYTERGYINSGAVLPNQRVTDGRVRYEFVEGELSEIEVRGTERLRDGYVRDRVMLGSGPPLNINDLQRQIQILLDDPLIERIDANLGPGTRPGDSRLELEVQEGPLFDLEISFDNYRAPSVGELQGGARFSVNSLSGWGETLVLQYSRTEGLRDFQARLEAPLSRHDTRLFFRFQDSRSNVVEEPFNQIDVDSESRDYELGLRHPLIQNVGQSLTGSISINPRKSTTFLGNRPFEFSRGVRNGQSKVTPLRIAFDWLDRSRAQVIAARSTFSIGLDLFNPSENPSPLPDGEFFSWLGQFQWVRRLNERDDQIVVRLDGQWTPDELLPLEKFGVGGPLSVRGYRTNQLVRDNGFSATVESRIPLFRLPIPGLSKGPVDGRIELAPFVDFGGAWNAKRSTPQPQFLSSIGAGFRWRVSDRVFADIYFAKALNNVPDASEDSLQDSGVSFKLVVDAY